MIQKENFFRERRGDKKRVVVEEEERQRRSFSELEKSAGVKKLDFPPDFPLNCSEQERDNLLRAIETESPLLPKAVRDSYLVGREQAEQFLSTGVMGFTFSGPDLIKEREVAMAITSNPSREERCSAQIRECVEHGVPVVLLSQQFYDGRNCDSRLVEGLIKERHPFVANFNPYLGPDISMKRQVVENIADAFEVKMVDHLDSDVQVIPSLSEVHKLAQKVLDKNPRAMAFSLPVMKRALSSGEDWKNFLEKPRGNEDLNRVNDGLRAIYGMPGVDVITRIPFEMRRKMKKAGVSLFPWLNGLYGEWVPASGVIRTLGGYSVYPEQEQWSKFYSVNVVDETNIDVRFASTEENDFRPIVYSSARVLSAGAKTAVTFGLDPERAESLFIKDILSLGEIDDLSAGLKDYYRTWYEFYIKTKVLEKLAKRSEQTLLEHSQTLAILELRRTMPFCLQQSKALKEISGGRLVPPFSKFYDEGR